jgi:hypothetical protein
MRALLEIDENLLAAAEREAERIVLPTFRGQGLRPGVSLDDSAALLELMEAPVAS